MPMGNGGRQRTGTTQRRGGQNGAENDGETEIGRAMDGASGFDEDDD